MGVTRVGYSCMLHSATFVFVANRFPSVRGICFVLSSWQTWVRMLYSRFISCFLLLTFPLFTCSLDSTHVFLQVSCIDSNFGFIVFVHSRIARRTQKAVLKTQALVLTSGSQSDVASLERIEESGFA